MDAEGKVCSYVRNDKRRSTLKTLSSVLVQERALLVCKITQDGHGRLIRILKDLLLNKLAHRRPSSW